MPARTPAPDPAIKPQTGRPRNSVCWFGDGDPQKSVVDPPILCYGRGRYFAMKITEALFAEHLVFHHMFDHIEAVVPNLKTAAEVKALAAMMEAMLCAHSKTEDELFIGPLEHCFEQIGQRETFHQEHVEIDKNLRLVQAARQTKIAKRLLLAAVAYSRRHFDREERVVFPMAERVLKIETLESLGRVWMDQRNDSAIPAAELAKV